MATVVGELEIGLKFDSKSLDSSIKETAAVSEQSANKIASIWSAAGDSIIRNVAVKAFDAVATSVSDFASSIVTTGMQFDTAMSQVAATMGTTTDKIEILRDTAIEMGSTTKYTATEAAQGLNILAQAGLSAEQQISGIPVVLDLASAGAMSLESSASYVVGAVNGFSDSMDNAQYYADLMAKGATLANTSVAGLGEAFSRSAATASSYGQQADSVTLALLRLASQNVTGEAAATAMNRAMADLYTPTKDAALALSQLGIAVYDSSGSARDFNVVADEIAVALSNMSDEEANAYAATIFTTEGLNAFNKMTAISADTVAGFKDGLDNAFGAAASQASVQIDNLEGGLTLLDSKFDGLKLQLYEGIKPALEAGINALNGLADGLSWVIKHGDIVLPILGALAAGVAAYVAYTTAVNVMKNGWMALTIVQKGAAVAQAALNAVMLINPIGLIVAGIAALIAGLVLLWNNCEGFRDFIGGMFESIGQFVGFLGEQISDFFNGIVEWLTNLPENISAFINTVITFFMELPANLQAFFTSILVNVATWIGEMVGKAIELGGQFLSAIGQFFSQLPYNIGMFLATALLTIGQFVVDAIAKAIELGTQFLQNVIDFFIQLPINIWNFLTEAFNFVVTWVSDMIAKAIEIGTQFLQNIINFFTQLPGRIWNFLVQTINNVVNFAKDFVAKAVQAGKDFFDGLVNKVLEIPDKMIEIGKNIVEGIWNGISGAAGWLWDQISGFCSGIVDGIKSFFGINSPSTLFRDDVGVFLAQGIGVGFEEEMKSVSKEMADSLPTTAIDGVDSWISSVETLFVEEDDNMAETDTSEAVNINQTNNIYSAFDFEQVNEELLQEIRRVA